MSVHRPEQARALDQALDRVGSHAQPPKHGQHLPGQGRSYAQDADQFRTHARSLAGPVALRPAVWRGASTSIFEPEITVRFEKFTTNHEIGCVERL